MLRSRFMVIGAILAAVVLSGATFRAFGTGASGGRPSARADGVSAPDSLVPPGGPILDFFASLNGWRKVPLVWDPILAASAQAQVNEMIAYRSYALVNPGTGVDMPTRARSLGAVFDLSSQGLARGHATGLDLFLAMPGTSSATSTSFRRIGVGYSTAHGGTWAYLLAD